MKTIVDGLQNMREDLLRQLVLSSRGEKTDLVIKIMEIDELIKKEEESALTAEKLS